MAKLGLLLATALALVACSTGGRETEPSPGPAVSASPPAAAHVLPEVPPAAAPPSERATWADLPAGRPPVVPYVDGDRYVLPQGRSQTLASGRRGVSGVVPFAGGFLVSDERYFEGSNGLELVRNGQRDASWPSAAHCSSGRPTASPDGRYVAWVTVRCPETRDRTVGAVHRAAADGTAESTEWIGPGLASVVGFVGHRLVYNLGFQDGAWVTDFVGSPRRIPGVVRVLGVSRASGWLLGARGDAARVVVDLDGEVRWRLDAGSLVAFSPEGTRVLAVAGRRVTILRGRDGSTIGEVVLAGGAESWSAVWETDRTLLTLRTLAGRVAIVRVHLGGRLRGRLERVGRAVPVEEGQRPYRLLPPPPSP